MTFHLPRKVIELFIYRWTILKQKASAKFLLIAVPGTIINHGTLVETANLIRFYQSINLFSLKNNNNTILKLKSEHCNN